MNLAIKRENYQRNAPHTFNSMQGLVMAMEKAINSRGKKTFFGHDKGRIAYEEFLEKLRATLRSLVLDGILEESADGATALDAMRGTLQAFAEAFPSWPAAYQYAGEFFGDSNRDNAIAVIQRLR